MCKNDLLCTIYYSQHEPVRRASKKERSGVPTPQRAPRAPRGAGARDAPGGGAVSMHYINYHAETLSVTTSNATARIHTQPAG